MAKQQASRPSLANQEHVRRAIARGAVAGLAPWAIFAPGEEVRCPVQVTVADGTFFCAAYVLTNGPEKAMRAREYHERQFHERRRTSRGKFPCRGCCGRHLELEGVEDPPAAAPAAAS